MEIKAREAIRATLDDSQAALFNKLGGQRLADVDTGHDPMAKALQ